MAYSYPELPGYSQIFVDMQLSDKETGYTKAQQALDKLAENECLQGQYLAAEYHIPAEIFGDTDYPICAFVRYYKKQ